MTTAKNKIAKIDPNCDFLKKKHYADVDDGMRQAQALLLVFK